MDAGDDPSPRSPRRGASGSPRKWRSSRRCTASSPGQSASSRTVHGGLGAGLRPPHEGGQDRIAVGGVTVWHRAGHRTAKPDRRSRQAAAQSPHIAWNCCWNARVVVERRSCACSAGQEDRNGRLPHGRASEAPHRGQVRASRASRVGEERGRAEERRGPGGLPAVELAQGAAAAAGAARRQRGDVLVPAGEADVQVVGADHPEQPAAGAAPFVGDRPTAEVAAARGRAVVVNVIVGPLRLMRSREGPY